MLTVSDLNQHPNPLAQHYSEFNVAKRLLFTGHSHQAWPDCGFKGQMQAWRDAASLVDKKWGRAAAKADKVQQYFSHLLTDDGGDIALGQSTFELVVRFLSALPLRQRPRIVTTDSEFHSLRRLLNRLSEEGIELVVVAAEPRQTFIERLCAEVTDLTAVVCCSKVFYNTGLVVGNLKPLADCCRNRGAELLVDAYHHLNVIPFAIGDEGLQQAYIVGGGYKYCQLGEGNCFIRLPKECRLRPVATGWYGEFDNLAQTAKQKTLYESGPARFAGATYDPTSHYRAVEVIEFFQAQQLTPSLLREISQQQLRLLQESFLSYDFDPAVISVNDAIPLSDRGGFLVYSSPHAAVLTEKLLQRGVACDSRGPSLRFGPAPYLSARQCRDAMVALNEVVQEL